MVTDRVKPWASVVRSDPTPDQTILPSLCSGSGQVDISAGQRLISDRHYKCGQVISRSGYAPV